MRVGSVGRIGTSRQSFGVSEPTIVRAVSVEDWPMRAWRIEDEARRAADKRATRTVAQRIERALAIVDATASLYPRGLQSGQTTISASEMAQMLKLEQVLVGGPSERIAGESGEHRRSLAEIEAELAELGDDQVGALLAADRVVQERVAELPAAGETNDCDPDPLRGLDAPSGAPRDSAVSGPVASVEDDDAENGRRRDRGAGDGRRTLAARGGGEAGAARSGRAQRAAGWQVVRLRAITRVYSQAEQRVIESGEEYAEHPVHALAAIGNGHAQAVSLVELVAERRRLAVAGIHVGSPLGGGVRPVAPMRPGAARVLEQTVGGNG